MAKLTLESTEVFLANEGDYTVRLLKREMAPPERYIFAFIRFDRTGLWEVRIFNQNRVISKESTRTFSVARGALITEVARYLHKRYKITKAQTGYDAPPWLKRKRA